MSHDHDRRKSGRTTRQRSQQRGGIAGIKLRLNGQPQRQIKLGRDNGCGLACAQRRAYEQRIQSQACVCDAIRRTERLAPAARTQMTIDVFGARVRRFGVRVPQ